MTKVLRLAAGVAADTATYLLAWWAVPLWALAAAVFLQGLARGCPLERWARSDAICRRLAGAFLLAVARPLGRSDVRRHLGRLEGRPGATAVYLAAGHGLTVYYFVLLGPLLGKDVLLSHVLGMLTFAGLATGFAVLLRVGGPPVAVGLEGGGRRAPATSPEEPTRSRTPAPRRDWAASSSARGGGIWGGPSGAWPSAAWWAQ